MEEGDSIGKRLRAAEIESQGLSFTLSRGLGVGAGQISDDPEEMIARKMVWKSARHSATTWLDHGAQTSTWRAAQQNLQKGWADLQRTARAK